MKTNVITNALRFEKYPKINQSAKCLRIGILAGLLSLASTGYSAVIYLNNFGNNTRGDIAMNNPNVGWNILSSQNGASIIDSSTALGGRMGINSGVGKPSDASNINAPVSLSNTNGIAYLSNGSTVTYKALYYTTQFQFSLSDYTIESFEWYANVSTADVGITQRLAIKIDSDWYVSDAVNPVQGSFGNFYSVGSSLQTIDFSLATWYTLSGDIGSTFSIGSSTLLPTAGDITAFGLYLDNGSTVSNYNRFDTFTINALAIPEPSALILMLGGVVLLAIKRNRTCLLKV